MKTSFISESTDQELSMQELTATNGGLVHAPTGPVMKVIGKAVENFGRLAWKAIKDQPAPITGPFVNTPIM